MNASHLREHVLANDRLVGGNGNTRISLYQSAYFAQSVFTDTGFNTELVFKNSLHACKRGIATTLTQSVHRDMQTARATQHSSQRIGYGKVVIVMCMKFEVSIRITLYHLTEILRHLHRVEYAQCIGQEETLDAALHEGVHHLEYIVGRILHATTPILKIQIYSHTLLHGKSERLVYSVDMFFGSLLELMRAMLERTLCKQVYNLASAFVNPVD